MARVGEDRWTPAPDPAEVRPRLSPASWSPVPRAGRLSGSAAVVSVVRFLLELVGPGTPTTGAVGGRINGSGGSPDPGEAESQAAH